MLRSGKEHLELLRDGRVVYIGNEKVDDVTTHPAFRNAAQTVAALYDMKADPALRAEMTYEEDGGRHSIYFLRARSREDLQRRMIGHRRIADFTYGLFGRSPDHVASFITGMAMNLGALPAPNAHPDNVLRYYKHARDNDLYVAYAVLPPQAARDPNFYLKQNLPVPTLRVVREEDDGVVISGMKMLATGAVFANDIWIGNVIPLAPEQKKESITCAIPCNAPGLRLWSRKPMETGVTSEFDSPLSYRYDESDSMLLCDEVKVPWEKVFVHDDAILAREIYIKTPSHCFGNHQSNVRYWSKMRLIVGLCARIANATGADQVPAVKETLGRISAQEAMIAGMVNGQINAFETWPGGAGRLRLLQPPHDVRRARLVHPELLALHRRFARTVRRRRVPDAGRYFGDAGRRAGAAIPDVLADAAMRRGHAHEAVQAGLGHGRLGIRRPPSAIRKILRRRAVHHPQSFLPRDRLGVVHRDRRQADGWLRLSKGVVPTNQTR